MSKRDLMNSLGDAARRERSGDEEFDELFDALQRGELTDAQRKALASRDDRAQLEALARPLDASFRRAVSDRVSRELDTGNDTGNGTGNDTGNDTTTRANVVPLPTRKLTQRFFVPFAAAATMLLAVGLFTSLRDTPSVALPDYSLSLAGAVTNLRGGSTPVARAEFVDGNFFDLQLTPDTAVSTDLNLTVRVYVVNEPGAEPIALAPQPAAEVTDKGVVIVEGEVGDDVRLPPGDSTVVVVLGNADTLPGPVELQRLLTTTAQLQGSDWRGWQIAVHKR